MGTSLALNAGVRIAILTLWLLTAAACSPAQRVAVGGGIAAVGLGVTYASIESMAGSCSLRGPDGVCSSSSNLPTHPNAGLPGVLAGLGTAVLGAVVIAGVEHRLPPPTDTPAAPPAPPEKPAALDETEAVGMAVARLVVRGAPPVRRKRGVGAGINGNSRPARLLGVDDTKSSFHVEGRRAELWNLRVRTASDEGWRLVGACYEYDSDWRLTSLGTTPGCPR